MARGSTSTNSRASPDFILDGGMGAGGAAEYARQAELDRLKRNEMAALTRALKGETLTIDRAPSRPVGSGFFDLLKDLLN